MSEPRRVTTEVGPLERAAGHAYVHRYQLDDGRPPLNGQSVVIVDGTGTEWPAVVVSQEGARWRLRLDTTGRPGVERERDE